MSGVGQPSNVMEEEYIDIPVNTERRIGYAPVAPEQGEDVRAEESEPDPEEDLEEDPEEEEAGSTEYRDGMGSTADDIIEELTTNCAQLEGRIAHLEGQNVSHQEREGQQRVVAYKREVELRELKQQLEQLQQNQVAYDHHMMTMGEHWAQAEARTEKLQTEKNAIRAQLQMLERELTQTREDRNLYYDAWRIAVLRVRDLEAGGSTSVSRSARTSLPSDPMFRQRED